MIASIAIDINCPILQLRVRRFLESGWDEARSWHNFSIHFVIGRTSILYSEVIRRSYI